MWLRKEYKIWLSKIQNTQNTLGKNNTGFNTTSQKYRTYRTLLKNLNILQDKQINTGDYRNYRTATTTVQITFCSDYYMKMQQMHSKCRTTQRNSWQLFLHSETFMTIQPKSEEYLLYTGHLNVKIHGIHHNKFPMAFIFLFLFLATQRANENTKHSFDQF